MSEPENQAPIDDREQGETLIQAMSDLFEGAAKSEQGANAEQVLTLAMGKMQALGLMAVYHELRHGNDLQRTQIAALRALTEELRSSQG